MIHLIVQASKYLMIFLFLVYTFECFHVFKFEGEEEEQKHIYHVQRTLLFLFHFDAFLVLYITTKNFQLIGFYLMQVIVIAAIIGTYHLFYKHASELVLNNMCMLLTIGFVILTRISFEKAFRQFIFVCAGFVISLLIPMVLQNMTLFRKLTWVYVIVGVGALGVVAIAGQTSYGAKLSLSIGHFDHPAFGVCKNYFCHVYCIHAVPAPGFSSGHGDKHFFGRFCSDAGSIQRSRRSPFVFFYLPGYGLCGDAQICVFRRWNTGNDRGESAWVPAV